MKRYYSLYQNEEQKTADLYIYGDITSWEWLESDVSSYNLSRELQALEDVENINVYINSYGGEVAEGLAIYNSLKRHKAKVTTIADGFACSIASVIFAAGDERLISNTSMLMIHNAWSHASGDSNDFKKQAEDLEKITQASINAYMNVVSLEEDALKEMMNTDTWINGNEALDMGFATQLIEESNKQVATQSLRKSMMKKITKDPEKVMVANLSFDENKLEDLVSQAMDKFKGEIKQGLDIDQIAKGLSIKLEQNQDIKIKDIKNKPLNMMKVFFNTKEEQ